MFKQYSLLIFLITITFVTGCSNNSVSENGDDDPVCGNGIIEEGEICDGGSKSCTEIDGSIFSGGNANCREDCSGWETSTCESETIVCEGDYEIRTKSELDEIMLCREITGDLSIVINDTKEVYLPFLEKTGGSVVLAGFFDEENWEWILYDDFSVEKLTLPKLKEIGQSFLSRPNVSLKSVEIPMLEEIGFGLSFIENSSFISIEFPALIKIGSSLSIRDSIQTKSISFPELKEIYIAIPFEPGGNFGISGNDSLEEIYFPKLEKVGRAFGMNGNSSLKSFEFPSLSSIGMRLTVEENDNLEEFRFQKLDIVVEDLTVWLNEKLKYFEISGELVVGEEFLIYDNPVLESFSLDGFKRAGWYFEISFNRSLKSFSAPDLEDTGDLLINKNISLEDFELLSLSLVRGDFIINDNSQLPTSKAESLKDQVLERDGIGGEIVIKGNKND
jgi:hypothetical protein